VIYMIASSIWE